MIGEPVQSTATDLASALDQLAELPDLVNLLDTNSPLDNLAVRQDLQNTLDLAALNFNRLVQLLIVGLGNTGTGNMTGPAGSTAGTVPCFADTTGLVLEDSLIPCDHLVAVDTTGISEGDQLIWTSGAWDYFTPGSSGGEPFLFDGTQTHGDGNGSLDYELRFDVTSGYLPLNASDVITYRWKRTSNQAYQAGATSPPTVATTAQRVMCQADLGDGVTGDGFFSVQAHTNSGLSAFVDGPYIYQFNKGTGGINHPYAVNMLEINMRVRNVNTVYRGMGGKISFGYNNGNGQNKWTIGASCIETGTGAVSENTTAAFTIAGNQQAFTRNLYAAFFPTNTTNNVLWLGCETGPSSLRLPVRTDGGTNIITDATFGNTSAPPADSVDYWTEDCALWGKCNDGPGTIVRIGPSLSQVPGEEAPLVTSTDGGTVTATGNQFTVNLPASGSANVTVTTPFIPGVLIELNCQVSVAVGTGGGLTSIQFGDGTDADRFGVLSTFTLNSLVNRDDWTVATEQQGGVYFTISTAGTVNIVLTPIGGDWDSGTIVITVFINKSTIISY